MLGSRFAKLGMLTLILLNFAPAFAAKGSAKKSSCSVVFEKKTYDEIRLGRNVFRLQEVPKSEQYLGFQMLSATERKTYFGEVNSKTPMSKAIQLMARLPKYLSGTEKAEIWNELTHETLCGKGPCLDSTMYVMDGPRYLFKGESSDSLFIDHDGTIYGARVRVEEIYDNGPWQPDYARMQRVSH